MGRPPTSSSLAFLLFFLLATANSAGYRYGASDLAFYAPAVMQRLEPGLFPRDTPVIRAQAGLTLMDETVAVIARLVRVPLPALFLALYVATLALLAFAASRVGGALYRERWTAIALLAALTLKHAIARSGTNTLEAYFHPRQLAFGFGVLAVGFFLRGRLGAMAAAAGAAATLHPTTTLWFAIWLLVAVFVAEPAWRRRLALAAIPGSLAVSWIVLAGPFAPRLRPMDPEWLAAIGEKTYLFPLDWPWTVWLLNLGYLVVIAAVYRARAAAGVVQSREAGLVAGAFALAAVFVASLPFNAARVALAIQLQPARVFWMIDFLAIAYVVWWLAEAPSRRLAARSVAIALAVLSAARGVYIMTVLFPERSLVQVDVPANDWGRVMAWAAQSDPGSGWLADPMHAARYGTSVRVAGRRDVLVEALKDAALGMYDRAIAIRTRDRIAAVGDFAALSAARARQLAADYDLEYLVTERTMEDLPLAFQSGPLRIYRLE